MYDNTRVSPNVILLRFKSSMQGKESLLPRNKTNPSALLQKRRGLYIYTIFYNNITIIGKNVTQHSKYKDLALLHLLLQNHFKT